MVGRRHLLVELKPEELEALRKFMSECARKGKWRARRRGNIVYLSHQRRTVRYICQQMQCSPELVYNTLRRYRQKGAAGLADLTRPVKLTPEQVNQLMEVSHWAKLLDKNRQKEFRGGWPYRQMARWVKDTWGIKLSHEWIRQIAQKKLWGI